MLAVHAAVRGGVRALQVDMSVRPVPASAWPRARPCCVCCPAVAVPDEGTASAFLGPRVVHGRAHMWKPGSDVLALSSARKRRERAMAEGKLDATGAAAASAAAPDGGAEAEQPQQPPVVSPLRQAQAGPGGPRGSVAASRQSVAEPESPPLPSPVPSHRSSGEGSATGLRSFLFQLAASGSSMRRVVSVTALNRARVHAGAVQFGEVFGDDAVATMAFADGVVPAAPSPRAAGPGFSATLPDSPQRRKTMQPPQRGGPASGRIGLLQPSDDDEGEDDSEPSGDGPGGSGAGRPGGAAGPPPRRRKPPPAPARKRSSSDSGQSADGPARRRAVRIGSVPQAKLGAASGAPMSPIPEGSVGDTEADGASRRSIAALGLSDRSSAANGSPPPGPPRRGPSGASPQSAGAQGGHIRPQQQQQQQRKHDVDADAGGGGPREQGGEGGHRGGSPNAQPPPAEEQAICTMCLPRACCVWVLRIACCERLGSRGGVQSKAMPAFSPVHALVSAGSEAAVSWTLFSDRPALRLAAPIVGNEPAPQPLRSLLAADALGLEPRSADGHAPRGSAGSDSADQLSADSPFVTSPLRGVALPLGPAASRASIGATALLRSSAREVNATGADSKRASARRTQRYDSFAVELRNRSSSSSTQRQPQEPGHVLGRRSRADSDLMDEVSRLEGSQMGEGRRASSAAGGALGGFPRGALPGEAGTSTVMALGRSFVLRGPTGAAAEESGATAGSRQAGMHSVEIMPEYLDVLPVDWFWTRVWALTRPERLLDALFLLPVVVWLASGLSPRVIGACVTGLNFWRVLRAARVAKVLRYYGGFRLLLEAFSRKFDALATSWLLCACGAVLLAGLIFVAEFGKDSEFDEMGSAVWWSVITLTTVRGPRRPSWAAPRSLPVFALCSAASGSGCLAPPRAAPCLPRYSA